MEGSLLLDVNLNNKFGNSDFIIKKRVIFNFFYCINYTTKKGQNFSINTIKDQDKTYLIDKINGTYNLSLSLFTPKNDDRPFVLCLEKFDNKLIYYGLSNKKDLQWKEIEEQNFINDDNMLLYVLKNQYAKYFESVIDLNNHSLFNLYYEHEDIKYVLVHSFFNDIYDKYHFKPDKAHSLKEIKLDGLNLTLSKNLNFVQDVYVYYADFDLSTPLLIETVEFKIGDKVPLINYFIAVKPGSLNWIDVYSEFDLTFPKCEGDITRILVSQINKYKNRPVELNITLIKELQRMGGVNVFSGVPFYSGYLFNSKYGYNMYSPRVGGAFLIESLVINDKFQDIEIQAREYSNVFIYYLTESGKPILICFGLKEEQYSPLTYIWYSIEDSIENKWKQIDFFANPENDFEVVEKKVDHFFGTQLNIKNIVYRTIGVSIFTFGTILGTYFGVKYSNRIVGSFLRFYNNFRRLVRRED